MKTLISLLALAACALPTLAADLNAGKAKAEQLCASCHNVDGNSSNPQYPVLAGQHADYLARVLLDYQSGARNNAIMAGMAKPLSKADIANLSAWFAAQKSGLNMKR